MSAVEVKEEGIDVTHLEEISSGILMSSTSELLSFSAGCMN